MWVAGALVCLMHTACCHAAVSMLSSVGYGGDSGTSIDRCSSGLWPDVIHQSSGVLHMHVHLFLFMRMLLFGGAGRVQVWAGPINAKWTWMEEPEW